MVASHPSALEGATQSKAYQERRLSHADEKSRAANETATQPPARTAHSGPPDKAVEAGIATYDDAPRKGSSSTRSRATTGPSGADEKETGRSPRPSTQSTQPDIDEIVDPTGDFQGEVMSNDELPSPETIRRIEDYIVLDRHGKTHTFKSLYTGRHVARRVLIIFVRHFFCGSCQEYLRTLSESITPESLLQLPIPTFIAVVGCGDPALIEMYQSVTGSPFPVYADPKGRLYKELGMVKTLALGSRPAYARKSLVRSSLESAALNLKHIKSGLAFRGGDQRQIGGEFLFEPLSLFSPDLPSPVQEDFDRGLTLDATVGGKGTKEKERDRLGVEAGGGAGGATRSFRTTSVSDNDNDEVEEPSLVEEKKVTWCHRMRTTRDHAEIPELMEVLGLNGQGEPIKDQKRWTKAVELRKGTGLSLAGQMSRMSHQNYVGSDGE
ncbi:hypothetical protein VPNG_06922 [Cytospora leucostoma]|uniref:Uncharacterized protein n=1 Tax=Cytospora leucostoma TaxID=1230097 RepID=A0A423WX95_9PEZI|nr:hypothetical protein VPNG_06922 [Cytospora leucostoma]